MLNEKKINYGNIAIFLIFTVYSYALISFVWIDGLASFASDSANYMLMALYLSPWQETTDVVKEIWPYQFFPPFYSVILGLTGAAHNFIAAHIITTLFLLASLPLIYFFARNCINNHWQAVGITILFSISPSTWLNSMGILSENLYIFLSFIIILMFQKIRFFNYKTSLLFGLILSALILTRSIGITMFAAFLLIGLIYWKNKEIEARIFFIPIITVILINLLAKILSKSVLPKSYIHEFHYLDITGQPDVLYKTWFSSWQYYWVDDLFIPQLFVLMLGFLACIGLIIRLRLLKIDAYYLLFYFAILLVWPHPGQALRFIYPVHALLTIYAFYSVYFISKNYSPDNINRATTLLLLISLITVTPTLAYLWNRYHAGLPYGYQHIYEFYRFPDLNLAKNSASTQSIMFNDMKSINSSTELNDTILYFTPEYIALLANRHSKKIEIDISEDNKYSINNLNDANYIYLSKLHPRKTREGINGLGMHPYIKDDTIPIWASLSSEKNETVSLFLKVKK